MPFSLRKLTKLNLLALCILAVTVITALTMTRHRWLSPTAQAQTQNAVVADVAVFNPYVERVTLPPNLRDVIKIIGNRFEQAGKERLTLDGVLTRPTTGAAKSATRLITEYPDKLRPEEDDGKAKKVTLFDGKKLDKQGDTLKQSDEDEIESLLYDSVDRFFAGQAEGQAMRYLGARFRPKDADPKTYKGPLYDLYEVIDQIKLKKEIRQQRKTYSFNSDTQFLEAVQYQIDRAGTPVNVQVKYSGWKKIEDQYVPTSIVRHEDGKQVLALDITTVTVGKKADDGIFTLPATTTK